MKNMKLLTKLALGFGVPLLALVGVVIGTYVVAGNVKGSAKIAQVESKESFGFAVYAERMILDVTQVQQWLTDISATRALDGLDDGFDAAEKSKKSFLHHVAKFKEMYNRENDIKNLQEIEEITRAFEVYYAAGRKMAQAYIQGGPAAGNKFMGEFDNTAERLHARLNPFVEQQTLEGDSALISIVSSIDKLRSGVFVTGLLAAILSLVASWLVSRSITRPINRVIQGLNEGAAQVASASGQISLASQGLAEGSSEQAAYIEETSSSLEEMSSMTKQNADNAQQADNHMKEANQVVTKAYDSMTDLTTSMEEISKASEETSKIIKTIDEIAFQTNLLALNAAVEAARAGEAGAGFAVVADEVRSLAMRAADAAKNTAELIEGTVKKVKDGGDMVATTNEAFTEVATSASKVGELVGEIAAASNEQAKGIEQVNKAVLEMDKVVQQNAANAEESASASEEMSAQAEQMKGFVDELVALVGGSAGADQQVYQTRTATPVAATRRVHTAPVQQIAAREGGSYQGKQSDSWAGNSNK